MIETTIGFALCGSFCTFDSAVNQMIELKSHGFNIIPIMSFNAFSLDTRFGKADDFKTKIEKICNNKIISTIPMAEPIGPKKLLDALVVEPCTGNTLAKLANGVADTPVTLAVKSHLRNLRPVIIGVSTNDAFATAAQNIGKLMNFKNIYFIPMSQDDCENKPRSVVAHFDETLNAVQCALEGKQIQPMFS